MSTTIDMAGEKVCVGVGGCNRMHPMRHADSTAAGFGEQQQETFNPRPEVVSVSRIQKDLLGETRGYAIYSADVVNRADQLWKHSVGTNKAVHVHDECCQADLPAYRIVGHTDIQTTTK